MITTLQNNTTVRFIGAALIVYITLGIFGGLPANANLGAFILGLAVLFLGILALMSFVWYAVIKPLPANKAPSKAQVVSHGTRQAIALFLMLMSAIGIAGGLWDATWHIYSGLPFGEDFFWEPHQFIYVALTMPILVAGFLWYRIGKMRSGSFQQRLRADIPLTLILAGGTAMLFILPADPIWHVIYGEDLTGLSVPHFVFSVSSTLTILGVISILLSYTPLRGRWESISTLRGVEIFVISMFSMELMGLLLPTLNDWETIALPATALPRLPALIAARPDWAMPFLAAFVGVYHTTIGSQIIKRFGAATLIWGVTSLVRSGLFVAFGYGDTGMSTMLMVLPFAIAVDLATWYRVSRNQPVSALFTAGVATIIGALAMLPQIPVWYIDPVLSVSNLPSIVVAMFVAAFLASWMGRVLGNVVANTVRFPVEAHQPTIARPVGRIMAVLTIVIIGIATVFVMTTSIPYATL